MMAGRRDRDKDILTYFDICYLGFGMCLWSVLLALIYVTRMFLTTKLKTLWSLRNQGGSRRVPMTTTTFFLLIYDVLITE